MDIWAYANIITNYSQTKTKAESVECLVCTEEDIKHKNRFKKRKLFDSFPFKNLKTGICSSVCLFLNGCIRVFGMY